MSVSPAAGPPESGTTRRGARERALDVLLSNAMWLVLPTPCAYLFNRVRMRDRPAMPKLPFDDWALAERRALLADSQGRLASLEGKGTGLATVTAVVIAGSVLAVTGGWTRAPFLEGSSSSSPLCTRVSA